MNSEAILVDCCALADLFVGEADFEQASANLRRKFPIWYSPALIKAEFGNVLRTQVRAGKMTAEKALEIWSVAIGKVLLCEEADGAEILKEANASCLTFYDATYVATARATGLPLYTRDSDILKYCPDVAQPIVDA